MQSRRRGNSFALIVLRSRVVYTQTATDVWADHVTRLSDDEVGRLTRPEALQLQADHLREPKTDAFLQS